MGKIVIKILGNIAKNIDNAIKKIMKRNEIKKLSKFKGIGNKNYDLNKHKEDWYLQ